MAQTTTVISNCQCIPSIDDDAGALTDISGTTSRITITIEAEQEENNIFAGSYKRSFIGKKTTRISLVIVYSSAADEAYDILKQWHFGTDYRLARTARFDIPDSSVGSDRYSGECELTRLDFIPSAETAGPLMVTADFVSDDTFSWAEIT